MHRKTSINPILFYANWTNTNNEKQIHQMNKKLDIDWWWFYVVPIVILCITPITEYDLDINNMERMIATIIGNSVSLKMSDIYQYIPLVIISVFALHDAADFQCHHAL